MKLVIVESPSKASTIEKYLGSEYKVLSSVGHIRDLATTGKNGLGVDVEDNFKPNYIVIKGKEKVVSELKKSAKKADQIYLATDPDREGEAISFHLFDCLELNDKNTKRVVFNEITKSAVLKAIDNPRSIDYKLVNSQEARRIVDRIIGFRLSKILWKKIKSKSAGRVQSVALKLICVLEEEINAFVSEEYHELFLHTKDKFSFKLEKYKNKKVKIASSDEASKIISSLDDTFKITDLNEIERKRTASLAFTTSSLQQQASSKLSFSAKKTMSVAQKLYEGKDIGKETTGLITYMRTDSTRLSSNFIESAKVFINNFYGKEYYKGYFSKNKENAQDAHEAIRPTDINLTPDMVSSYLSKDELRLYTLIYNRSLAAMMKDAIYNETVYSVLNNEYLFTLKSKVLVFDGFTKVYDQDPEELSKYALKLNQVLDFDKIEDKQLFTKPPVRYSEAKLIKKLEELGIGRPSTYASIIETLKTRAYVEVTDKRFVPTEQGILTYSKLEEYFTRFVDVKYTKNMEEELDLIATEGIDYIPMLREFYDILEELYTTADNAMEKMPDKEVGLTCPECGSPLVEKVGRFGKFIACSNYPTCKYIHKEKKEVKMTGVNCPKCSKELVERVATRGKNKGNVFYACSGYPKCDFITNDLNDLTIKEKTTKK